MKIFSSSVLVILSWSVVSADLEGVRFWLYTKFIKDNPVELKSNDINAISLSPMLPNKPVKILCHGVFSSYQFDFPGEMKDVYLRMPEDMNIITVDWMDLNFPLVTLDEAVRNAKPIGLETRLLINAIIMSGKSKLSDIHFIGHSLGAQIGAFITPNSETDGKLPRITGIDAVIPGFTMKTSAIERLDPDDADFVDIIHSSPRGIDFQGNWPNNPNPPGMGTVDFYPNGGYKQPGCALDMMNLCSHLMGYRYYQESIDTNIGFIAYKCDSYKSYKTNCVRENPVLMGEYVNKSIFGSYYFDTRLVPPFSKGFYDKQQRSFWEIFSWVGATFTNIVTFNNFKRVFQDQRIMNKLLKFLFR